jgi:hypothetical protein
MLAGPFRVNSFEPATTFEAKTCSGTVEVALVPSVITVKTDLRKNIENFYERRPQVPDSPWWPDYQLNLVHNFTRC